MCMNRAEKIKLHFEKDIYSTYSEYDINTNCTYKYYFDHDWEEGLYDIKNDLIFHYRCYLSNNKIVFMNIIYTKQ